MPLTAAQRETLINTVLGEAANQGTAGMQAVAAVIRNRADSGQFPSDPAEVATQHNRAGVYQFSANAAPGRAGGNNVAATASPATRARAAAAVDAVFSGAVADPTHGALYYHTGDVNPGWDNNMHQTAQIGAHTFYSPSPVPPGDIPATSSTADIAHLDALTNLTGLPYDPQPSVPLARVQPFSISAFNPFTLGDQLAFDPVTTADTGGARAPNFNVTPNAAVFTGNGMPGYGLSPGVGPDDRGGGSVASVATHPATVGDRASNIRDLLAAMSLPNASGSPDDRNVDLSQPIYTGQGIARTVQLPAGYHPADGLVPPLSSVPDPTGSIPYAGYIPGGTGGTAYQRFPVTTDLPDYGGGFNSMDAAAAPGSSSHNNDSWAQLMQSFGSPTSTASLSDIPHAEGSINNGKDQSRLLPGELPAFTTAANPDYNVPKTINTQKLNPAYTAWLNNPDAAIYGVSGVESPSLDANGNVVLPSSYLGGIAGAPARKPAPPKYLTVPIANPDYNPAKAVMRIPAAAPVVAPVVSPLTLIQQYQVDHPGTSSAAAYNAVGQTAMQQAANPNAVMGAITGTSHPSGGSIASSGSGSVISPFHSFRRGGIVA